MNEINGYLLDEVWVDFAKKNPEKIRPIHSAIHRHCIYVANKLGWPEIFQLPTDSGCQIIGIAKHDTFRKALKDLDNWGLIVIVSESKNAYTARFISHERAELVKNYLSEKGTSNGTSKGVSKVQVKGVNKTNKLKKEYTTEFEKFWDMYPVKTGKEKCFEKWDKLDSNDKNRIIETLPSFKSYKPFDTYSYPYPLTYLNQKRWNDELPQISQVSKSENKYTAPKQITIDHSVLD